jgi:predicted nucleic acid-binding protein
MQAIVADTTPLNYVVLIQAADILPNLYRRVLIPPAVKAELAHANTPAIVRAWISQPPAWLEVVSLKQPVDSSLEHLDAGEREAMVIDPNAVLPRSGSPLRRSSLFPGTLRASGCPAPHLVCPAS